MDLSKRSQECQPIDSWWMFEEGASLVLGLFSSERFGISLHPLTTNNFLHIYMKYQTDAGSFGPSRLAKGSWVPRSRNDIKLRLVPWVQFINVELPLPQVSIAQVRQAGHIWKRINNINSWIDHATQYNEIWHVIWCENNFIPFHVGGRMIWI